MSSNDVQLSRLPNGVSVVSKNVSAAHGVAIGIWLHNGARHQTPEENGYAHFLEHLWFKGTPHHTALQLAQTFERMGGQINAYTDRELTSLQATVPAKQLGNIITLFADMLMSPSFTEADVNLERDVVYQEMAMVEDNPEEAAAERAVTEAWAPHSLGWPILGEKAILEQLTAASVRAYLQKICVGNRLCIAATGAVDHADLLRFSQIFATLAAGEKPVLLPATFNSGAMEQAHDINQTQLVWVMPIPGPLDARLPAYVIANHILGGGWSSRLFYEIRELRGLAYSIHSRLELYGDTGQWIIQTGCDPDREAECRTAVNDVLTKLSNDGPTNDEMAISAEHIESALALEEDDLDACMERLARDTIYLGQPMPLSERVARLRGVTVEQVKAAFADYQRAFTLIWSGEQ